MSSYLVTKGRSKVVSLLVASGNQYPYLGFGIGSGTTNPSDEALFTEVQSRVSGTVGQATTVTAGDTYQLIATFTSDYLQTLTNIGIFDSGVSPVQDQLSTQVSTSSQGYINPVSYGSWPTNYPFDIQVTSEVMTIVSGNGSNTFYVLRGSNGSVALPTIPATTVITQVSGNLLAKTDFTGLSLGAGDVVQFTINLQFE